MNADLIVEARGQQDLRHRLGAGRRAAGRRPGGRAGRDGRDHGSERLRQDDAAELPLGARRDRRRRRAHRGPIAGVDVGSRAHRLPRPPHGLRVPVLQPDAGADRGRERRAAAARRAGVDARGSATRALEALELVGLGDRARPRTRRAVRWRAPTRHDRTGAGERSRDRVGRRADRRPRQREGRRDRRV